MSEPTDFDRELSGLIIDAWNHNIRRGRPDDSTKERIMRGIPTYSQLSVAFPTSVPYRDSLDEINVSFDAKGGGTHGEFTFKWVDLHDSKYPIGALEVCCFSDGLGALLDERIQRILRRIQRRKQTDRDMPPDQLLEWLEEEGIGPSTYHIRALMDRSIGREERARLSMQWRKLRRHEGAQV